MDKEVPKASVTDAGRPEDPWALPLSFTVDESLRPSADSVGKLDGRDRRVEALASPDGETMELMVDELIVGTVDDEALAPLIERRGGEVLWKVGSGSSGFSLVRIEPGPADPEGVAKLARDLGDEGVGLQGGEQRVSHPDVLGVLAAMLEENEQLDAPVSPNVVMSLATVGEGTTVEADQLGSTGLTRDACSWPHMQSGGAQDIGVCDAWRLLIQEDRADSRVDVGVIDQGFAATPDTPAESAFHVPGMVYQGDPFWQGPPGATGCPASGDCSWHGTWTSSALGAVPDNAWGGAGPGGLNARIQHLEPMALLSDAIRDRLDGGAITLDQLQAALIATTTERLPDGGVAYVGVANHIPWPLSVLVHNALDPVFEGMRDAGILVFAPAGNALDVDHVLLNDVMGTTGWETALTVPCELTGVVCVGGLARDSNGRDPSSAFGSQRPPGFVGLHEHGTVDIFGPGTVAVGPDPDDELDLTTSLLRERQGTSLAAAFAAGVAVQVWAADPGLSPAGVEQIVLDTMHVGSSSPEVPGWVDAFAAVESAACLSTTTYYRDGDGDGYGDPESAEEGCLAPDGYVTDGRDCDDEDDGIFPGAEEQCDGVDQNCDPDDEEGLECDDGLFCTQDDACEDGECTGSGSPCDDDESCDEDEDECVASGCSEDDECDDGLYCNGDENCIEGSGECEDGERPVSDDVDCTIDSCDEEQGAIEHVAVDAACDDGLFCNGVESCDAIEDCQAGVDPCPIMPCDENLDACVPCIQASDCDDGLYCNGVESCNNDTGDCRAGVAPTTSDSVGCTIDVCNEATDSIEHQPSDAVCDDGAFCNGAETCHATLDCQLGTPPPLSDGVACTVDSCDEELNLVRHTPSAAACSDGAFCNGAEVCHATQGCQAGTAPALDDGVDCTVDTCDETADSVLHALDDAACSDGMFCNGVETCHATLDCRPGTPPVLTDGVACTVDTCNEAQDRVDHAPDDGVCDDALYCNGGETCHATLGCQLGDAPCAVSICDEATNVCDVCLDDGDCDDGLFCNGAETCNEGTGECFAGVAPTEDDDVDCTVDSCDEASDAFLHTPDDASCGDDLFCNGVEVCDEQLDCQAGTPPSAADSVACTADSCDEATDSFVHTPVNALCNDSLYCTGTETCHVTLGCQSSGDPCSSGHCNDTLDACVACLVDGHCADGLFCNGVELCNTGAGTCGPGPVPGLDDGLPCTTDTCLEATDSVSHAPVDAACSDGLYCNGAETCSATLGCQDGPNPCVGGCTEATDACFECNEDAECNDGQFCNGVESCNGFGQCVPGNSPALTDGVACTDDACDEASDTITHTPDAAACSNGLFCDGAEVCHVTLGCQAGTPPALTDGVACTTDSCLEATDTIVHTPDAAACSNGLFCDGAEVCHVTLGCQAGTPPTLADGLTCTVGSCDEANDLVVQTPNDAACDDLLFCNGVESCAVGIGCVPGTPPARTDGIPCTIDDCVEATDTITHTPNAAICSNGLFCDGDESCHVTLGCQAGTAPVLGDGVACTTDSCDEGADQVIHTPSAAACSNGQFCDGAEICHATLGCQAGGDPCPNLNCDEGGDVCTGCMGAADCDDDDPCTVDSCDSGDCSNVGMPFYYADDDGDGFGGAFLGCNNPGGAVTEGGDCDDEDDTVNPDATESCDGVDDDCDGVPDDGLLVPYYYDTDLDTYGASYYGHFCSSPGSGTSAMPGDCDDGTSSVRPGATETCNGSDDDCDGTPDDGVTYTSYYLDGDGDGRGGAFYGSFCSNPGSGTSSMQGDCDDGVDSIHPGATEVCNGLDDDCDGTPDDGIGYADYYVDGDGDGYGGSYFGHHCSHPGAGTSDTPGDCDDGDPGAHPGADEACDTADDDCDGGADEGLPFADYYYDSDGDGYGGYFYGSLCSDPGGSTTSAAGDCDDGATGTYPGASEVCDSADNDCDGVADDGVGFATYYRDADGDGFGADFYGVYCDPPGSGATDKPGDCDDDASDANPDASEVCDGRDNDCDGTADDGLVFVDYWADDDADRCGGAYVGAFCDDKAPAGSVSDNPTDCDDTREGACDCDNTCQWTDYFQDADGDGYGGAYYGRYCPEPGPPQGTTATPGDCDDAQDKAYPRADEVCDGFDNDCDGIAEEGLALTTYYYDSDGDGDGAAYYGQSCSEPGGSTTSNPGDCDDADGAIEPGAIELCNDVDDDCDGAIEEGLTFTEYYVDADADGSGGALLTRSCRQPSGSMVTVAGDCDDGDASIEPGASELCNDVDDDCDGVPEEGLTFTTYYVDADNDGTGAAYLGRLCSAPGGDTATTFGDCNDATSAIEPGAAELCDDYDNDCDGRAEEGLTFTTYYDDDDGDGSGGRRNTRACSPPGGTAATVAGDCDDGDGAIEPGAAELCNGVDDDCDGVAEDGLTFVPYFSDGDGDGYGAGYSAHACVDPGGTTASVWGDCLDADEDAYPGAPELCDGVDNDCDGPPDEGCP